MIITQSTGTQSTGTQSTGTQSTFRSGVSYNQTQRYHNSQPQERKISGGAVKNSPSEVIDVRHSFKNLIIHNHHVYQTPLENIA